MTTIEGLIRELEAEAQTTRRVLERVPDDKLGWKPHERSMSLGQLALHVATTPGLVAELSRTTEVQDIQLGPGINIPVPAPSPSPAPPKG